MITLKQLRILNFIISLFYLFPLIFEGQWIFPEMSTPSLATLRLSVALLGWGINYSLLLKIQKKEDNKTSN